MGSGVRPGAMGRVSFLLFDVPCLIGGERVGVWCEG